MRTYVIQANMGGEGAPFWITIVPTDGTSWKYTGRHVAWRYLVEHYLLRDGKAETHIEYRVTPESEVNDVDV